MNHRFSRSRNLAYAGAVFLIALMLLAPGIDAPFSKDAEPQSAQWIQSVASGANILLPRDYYRRIDPKPPLFYWLSGALTAISGGKVNETRARTVSLVAAAAIVAEVWLVASVRISPAAGIVAFFFAIGSYGFAARATVALTDMLMTLFVFSAWNLLFEAFDAPPRPTRILTLGLIVGLGILTKGPVVVALIALAGLLHILLTNRSIATLATQRWPWITVAIAILIASGWYIPALTANDHQYVQLFFSENTGHFLPAAMGGTGEDARPLYFIAVRMFSGMLPISLLLPILVLALAKHTLPSATRKAILFQLSLVAAVLIFFSVASAKRDDYILPALPSLAIAFAALFVAPDEPDSRWLARSLEISATAITTIMAAAMVGITIWTRTHPPTQHAMNVGPDRLQIIFLVDEARTMGSRFVSMVITLVLGSVIAVRAMLTRRTILCGLALGIASAAMALFVTSTIRFDLNRARTLKYAAEEIEQTCDLRTLRIVDGINYELSSYVGAGIAPLVLDGKIDPDARCLFAYDRELARLDADVRSRLKAQERWDLAGRDGPAALYEISPGPGDLKPVP